MDQSPILVGSPFWWQKATIVQNGSSEVSARKYVPTHLFNIQAINLLPVHKIKKDKSLIKFVDVMLAVKYFTDGQYGSNLTRQSFIIFRTTFL